MLCIIFSIFIAKPTNALMLIGCLLNFTSCIALLNPNTNDIRATFILDIRYIRKMTRVKGPATEKSDPYHFYDSTN
jgi:hypothetical protein